MSMAKDNTVVLDKLKRYSGRENNANKNTYLHSSRQSIIYLKVSYLIYTEPRPVLWQVNLGLSAQSFGIIGIQYS